MPAPTRLSRAEAKARTRAKLLEAAAEVFAERGFAGASVDEIATRAGFTVGALYSNFAGKDELFLELFDAHVAHHLVDMDRILDQPDHLAEFGRYLIKVADAHTAWNALEMDFLRYALTRPELLERLAERWRVPRLAIARLVAHDNPEAVATVILALFEGLVLQRRIDREAVPASLFTDALGWLITGAEISPRESR